MRTALRGYERYLALRASRLDEPTTHGGLPLPPPRLRILVAGSADLEWFLGSGRSQTDYLRRLLADVEQPIDSFGAVLDFGCGCGRMTRWWRDVEGPQFHGCDYNPELVAWCAASLPFVAVRRNGLGPPLPYQDGTFDLLYALSVLTHLPDALGRRWIEEFRRVLKPDGLLWVTTHGERFRDRLSKKEDARFGRGEVVEQFPELAGTNLCAIYHPPSYVHATLTRGFEVLHHLNPAAAPAEAAAARLYQDAYLLRRV